MNKTINILSIILILSILSSGLAIAADQTEDNEWFNFMKWKGTAKYYRDVYVPKELFYPLEDWEKTVCTDDVSTRLDMTNVPGVEDGGIYDTTLTVNAYKSYDSNSTDILYEVSYYFHPTYDREFTLKLTTNSGSLNYVIANTTASSVIGAMDYIAFKVPEDYAKAILTYGSVNKEYPIINAKNITSQ